MTEEQRTAPPSGGWSSLPGASPPAEPAAVVPRPDAHMRRVVRLETLADDRDAEDPRSTSVSARHEAVLDDGSRVLLLDDRGWTSSLRGAGAVAMEAWALESEQEIVETARFVVGPDEPYEGRTRAEEERLHWEVLAGTLRAHGLAADGEELRRLPHDVVLSERLRARLARTS